MKRLASILLLAALLTAITACEKKTNDPNAANTELSGDTVLVAEGYDVDFSSYLTVPDLSTVKVALADVEIYWDKFVKSVRYENIAFTTADEDDAAALTDEVNIHYKGYAASSDVVLDESTLENMTNIAYDEDGSLTDGYDLVLGSDNFIGAYESEEHPEKNNKSFEEQLIGMKAGEERTITVTYPDDYGSEELNGTVVKFDVTVNSLRKGTLPELTDEMISDYMGEDYPTISAAKEYIFTYYKEELAYNAILDAITVKSYPEDLIDRYISNYISDNYSETLSKEQIKTIYDEQYETACANMGARIKLEYLFKAFNITLTQDEYLKMLSEELDENSFYYSYYYDITTTSELEQLLGRDYLITQYKFDMLAPLLSDTVVFE